MTLRPSKHEAGQPTLNFQLTCSNAILSIFGSLDVGKSN